MILISKNWPWKNNSVVIILIILTEKFTLNKLSLKDKMVAVCTKCGANYTPEYTTSGYSLVDPLIKSP